MKLVRRKISIHISGKLSALMKAANPWTTYRTRFLVQAKQLTTNLRFTDALGRQHAGCKGDYLVESSDGAFRITPRQIFEDIYVPLLASEAEITEQTMTPPTGTWSQDYAPHPPKPSSTFSLPPHLARRPPQLDRRRQI